MIPTEELREPYWQVIRNEEFGNGPEGAIVAKVDPFVIHTDTGLQQLGKACWNAARVGSSQAFRDGVEVLLLRFDIETKGWELWSNDKEETLARLTEADLYEIAEQLA